MARINEGDLVELTLGLSGHGEKITVSHVAMYLGRGTDHEIFFYVPDVGPVDVRVWNPFEHEGRIYEIQEGRTRVLGGAGDVV